LDSATESLRSVAFMPTPALPPPYGIDCFGPELGSPTMSASPSLMAATVQVFGRRDAEAVEALGRPASEKRQGTKSRGVWGSDGAAGAMGIWPRRECRGGRSEAVDPIALRRSVGMRAGVSKRIAGCTGRFAVRRRADLSDRGKRGRCRPRAGRNGGSPCRGGTTVTGSRGCGPIPHACRAGGVARWGGASG